MSAARRPAETAAGSGRGSSAWLGGRRQPRGRAQRGAAEAELWGRVAEAPRGPPGPSPRPHRGGPGPGPARGAPAAARGEALRHGRLAGGAERGCGPRWRGRSRARSQRGRDALCSGRRGGAGRGRAAALRGWSRCWGGSCGCEGEGAATRCKRQSLGGASAGVCARPAAACGQPGAQGRAAAPRCAPGTVRSAERAGARQPLDGGMPGVLTDQRTRWPRERRRLCGIYSWMSRAGVRACRNEASNSYMCLPCK